MQGSGKSKQYNIIYTALSNNNKAPRCALKNIHYADGYWIICKINT